MRYAAALKRTWPCSLARVALATVIVVLFFYLFSVPFWHGNGELSRLSSSHVAWALESVHGKVRAYRGARNGTGKREAPMNNAKQGENPVRFYLYPFDAFPTSWGNHSGNGCDHKRVGDVKHDHADWVWNALYFHPWRTHEPKLAELAVLPISFDLMANGRCVRRFGPETTALIVAEISAALNRSGIFPKVRHLVIANDFKSKPFMKAIDPVLAPAGVWAGMEGRGECRTSLGYSTVNSVYLSMRDPNHFKGLPGMSIFSRPPAQRRYSITFVGQLDSRKAYQDRVALFQSNGSIPAAHMTTVIMNPLERKKDLHLRYCTSTEDVDRCVLRKKTSRVETQRLMEQSNYTLCLRGDTLGSDRWVNGMAAGTALIAVVDEDKDLDWLPFPDAVPWRSLVITIQRSTFRRDPAAALRQVMKDTSTERLAELQQLSRHYLADLDWSSYKSRAVDNLLREAISVPCHPADLRGGAFAPAPPAPESTGDEINSSTSG
ncbi:hypothetical protein HOP50_08g53830 [Chloropicon primus]|nr:hypothetical protein HOP50_08g53830 [Chloropicon primus]